MSCHGGTLTCLARENSTSAVAAAADGRGGGGKATDDYDDVVEELSFFSATSASVLVVCRQLGTLDSECSRELHCRLRVPESALRFSS